MGKASTFNPIKSFGNLLLILTLIGTTNLEAQRINITDGQQAKHSADYFTKDETNDPLLSLTWYSSGTHTRIVDQNGKGFGWTDVGYSIRGNWSIDLKQEQLRELKQTINILPDEPKDELPKERQIVLEYARSNHLFRSVYDRGNVPKEIENICDITGAAMPWYIPEVKGHTLTSPNGGGFFTIATESPVAISAGNDSIRVWNLNISTNEATAPIKTGFEYKTFAEYEHAIAVSPDGKRAAVAYGHGMCGIDLKEEKVLWKGEGPGCESGFCGHHLVIGDNGQTLFLARAKTIERMDLASGKNRIVIHTNEPNSGEYVQFLKPSLNGKVLIAGYGPANYAQGRPKSFVVFESGRIKPALKFEEKEGARADLSPDGEWVALSRFGTDKLILFKWRTGERKEVHLRNISSFSSAMWSPDSKRVAVFSDFYPAAMIVYDADSWKPISQWNCHRESEYEEYSFGTNGILYQIKGNEINALDVKKLKALYDR